MQDQEGKTPNLIPLSADETAHLIRNSNGRVLALAFGTGGAALKRRQSPWALGLLYELRRPHTS